LLPHSGVHEGIVEVQMECGYLSLTDACIVGVCMYLYAFMRCLYGGICCCVCMYACMHASENKIACRAPGTTIWFALDESCPSVIHIETENPVTHFCFVFSHSTYVFWRIPILVFVCRTPGATIRFTLDGSDPSDEGLAPGVVQIYSKTM
jgi:hypothetical protein